MTDEPTTPQETAEDLIFETLKMLEPLTDGQLKYLAYLLAQVPGINP